MSGTTRCARKFCVLPTHEGMMDLIREHHGSFNQEFGKHKTKLMLSLNLPINTACSVCDRFNLGHFTIVRMSETGMSAEVYVKVLSDRFAFREYKTKYVLAETIPEQPYDKCLRNGNIIIKGNLCDLRIDIATYKELVERMDNIVSEFMQKYPEYAEFFEDHIKSYTADWANYKYHIAGRYGLFSSNHYKRFENEAQQE